MPTPTLPDIHETQRAGTTTLREDRGPALRAVSTQGPILIVSEDPLMLRALDRLLRRAGYSVGVRVEDAEHLRDLAVVDDPGTAALTIVDVPDAWTRYGRRPNGDDWHASTRNGPVLWLSNTLGIGRPSDPCLVKPFTTSQLLTKIETLVNSKTSNR